MSQKALNAIVPRVCTVLLGEMQFHDSTVEKVYIFWNMSILFVEMSRSYDF